MTVEFRRLATVLILPALLLAFRADAATFDLDLYRYCSPGSNCGHASLADYDQFICETVQQVNVIWKPTGISFRPNLRPVDSTSPADPSGLPDGFSKYYQVPGCRAGDDNGDARVHWREQVAKANQSAISMMLTKGTNRCCSGIPRSWKDLDSQFGVYCDAHPARGVSGQGSLWAHELGHHWCLGHTHGTCTDTGDGQDAAADADAGVPYGCTVEKTSCSDDTECEEGGTCVPDDLPAVSDTPGDRCRFESCNPKCVNDPDKGSCTSDDDCEPGEGPCDCPGADEDMDGNLRDDHGWYAAIGDTFEVIPVATDLSYGSPHGSWCPVRVKSHTGGVFSAFDTLPPSEVTVRDVMSYHGTYCKGPYVVAGERREALSQDQLDRIAACRSDIEPRDPAHLPDVCANLGGDSDHDGICDDDDNCPAVLNTCQVDSDIDGLGDACDCPGAGPNSGDLDGDGIPDDCDADRDGDGCYNDPPEDDHPDQAQLLEKTFVQVGCGSGSKSVYVSDVADTDGDGIINCMDPDDDDDGLCDAPGPGCTTVGDPCPEVPGSFCLVPDAGAPCAPIWSYCGAPCVEHYIRFHDLINPDPTAELRFESVWVVNDTLFAAPQLGHSAAEDIAGIAALAGAAGGGPALISGVQAGDAAGAGAAPLLVVELWRREGGEEYLVDVIGRFQAGQLALGDLLSGGLLRLKPTTDDFGQVRLEASVSPGIGVTSDEARDRDGDGQADAIDNCVEAWNPGQRDVDGDGIGDRCGVDFDRDGITGDRDIARVRACAGADLLIDAPIAEPVFFDGEPLGDPVAEADPVDVAMATACATADLDGDWDVDADDAALAEERFGLAPGPSAFGGSGRAALPSTPGCASRAAIDRATLTLAKLDRAPGKQRFELTGRLPLSPELDPAGKGLSLRLSDALGSPLLETRIPGGPQWQQNRKLFHYRDDTGSQAISRAMVQVVQSKRAEFVDIKVIGKSLALGNSTPALPIVAELSLDPDAPASLQCGTTAFGSGPERPRCDSMQHGARVMCR